MFWINEVDECYALSKQRHSILIQRRRHMWEPAWYAEYQLQGLYVERNQVRIHLWISQVSCISLLDLQPKDSIILLSMNRMQSNLSFVSFCPTSKDHVKCHLMMEQPMKINNLLREPVVANTWIKEDDHISTHREGSNIRSFDYYKLISKMIRARKQRSFALFIIARIRSSICDFQYDLCITVWLLGPPRKSFEFINVSIESKEKNSEHPTVIRVIIQWRQRNNWPPNSQGSSLLRIGWKIFYFDEGRQIDNNKLDRESKKEKNWMSHVGSDVLRQNTVGGRVLSTGRVV